MTQSAQAVRPNGIFIESLQVSSTITPVLECPDEMADLTECDLIVSKYTIALSVHHCGHNMPLLTTSPDSFQVTRIAAGSPPVTGSFSIMFDGQLISSEVPAQMMEEGMKDLLESALPDEGTLDVVRGGTCAGYTWTVKWASRGGDRPSLQVNASNLIGIETSVEAETTLDGGVWMRPIRDDMLFLPELTPQVCYATLICKQYSVYHNIHNIVLFWAYSTL